MNIPLVEGRLFSDHGRQPRRAGRDHQPHDGQAYWPDENPIDRRVRDRGFDPNAWFRIVGVVEDVRHVSLTRDAGHRDVPADRADGDAASSRWWSEPIGDPAALTPAARAAVQAIDPNLPIYDVRTMEERIAGSFAQTRGTMLLLLVTAVLAAALSGVAIYGSIWYSVSQRHPGDRRPARARREPRVGVRRRAAPAR